MQRSWDRLCTGASLVTCSARTVGFKEFRGRRIVRGNRNDSGTLSVSGELAITSWENWSCCSRDMSRAPVSEEKIKGDNVLRGTNRSSS